MSAPWFVSHSFSDGHDFAAALDRQLRSLHAPLELWIPGKRLRLGSSWRMQVHDRIMQSPAVLFVMTEDSVKDKSCAGELIVAHDTGTPVIAVRAAEKVRLYPKHILPDSVYLDCTDGLETAAYRLIEESHSIDRIIANARPVDSRFWIASPPPRNLHGSIFIGRWQIRRKSLLSIAVDGVWDFKATANFQASVAAPLLNRVPTTGWWAYRVDPPRLETYTAGEMGTHLIEMMDGPNTFMGTFSGRDYVARRML